MNNYKIVKGGRNENNPYTVYFVLATESVASQLIQLIERGCMWGDYPYGNNDVKRSDLRIYVVDDPNEEHYLDEMVGSHDYALPEIEMRDVIWMCDIAQLMAGGLEKSIKATGFCRDEYGCYVYYNIELSELITSSEFDALCAYIEKETSKIRIRLDYHENANCSLNYYNLIVTVTLDNVKKDANARVDRAFRIKMGKEIIEKFNNFGIELKLQGVNT